MAQDISLWGANYADVPAVNLPKTGGGTASFTDVSDTTATASDVLAGSYFYTAAGQRAEGSLSLLDLVYPVGSIYMSTANVSPEVFLGGEWSPIEDTFLLSAGNTYTAGDSGGEAEHLLTGAESGQKSLTITGGGHSHTVTTKYRKIYEAGTNRDGYYGSGTPDGSNTTGATIAANTGGHTHWVSAADASNAHNNMPPYLVVYMWERIS